MGQGAREPPEPPPVKLAGKTPEKAKSSLKRHFGMSWLFSKIIYETKLGHLFLIIVAINLTNYNSDLLSHAIILQS